MDNKNQSGGNQSRQDRPRSGNGGRNRQNNQNRSRNRSRNRNRNRNHSGGNQSNNRNNQNRNRRGGRGRKPAAPPKRTLGQKILAVLTFGLLGKPTTKRKSTRPKAKPAAKRTPKPAPQKRTPIQTPVTSGRLYVGNLDYNATEDDLEGLFSGVGTVLSAEVVINSRTEQSKGFAFVEMNNIDEAKRAVDILHDQDFMGRKLLLSGAKSEGPRDGSNEEEAAA